MQFFHYCKYLSHAFGLWLRYKQSVIDSSHNCTELEIAAQEQMEWKTGVVLKRNFSVLVMIILLAHPAEKSEGCTQLVCGTSSCKGTLRSIHP